MAFSQVFGVLLCAFLVQARIGNLRVQFPEVLRSEIDGRVVNGYPAAEGQFPHQVHLLVENSLYGAYCGGSIISKRHILTAAHCLSGMSRASVRMGTNVLSSGTVMTSTQLLMHPQYNSNLLHNDIGIITLSSDIVESDLVKPIRLPSRSQADETFVDAQSIVSGWGLTVDGGSISQTLNYAPLKVITNAQCGSYYGGVIIDSTICCLGREQENQSSCNGDSGGPMIITDSDGEVTQIGVVSFGSSAGCASGAPSGYARTSKHLDWISQNTGIEIRP